MKATPRSVPVEPLLALASVWEDKASDLLDFAGRAADRGALPERTESMAAKAESLTDCARMLRAVITNEGAA